MTINDDIELILADEHNRSVWVAQVGNIIHAQLGMEAWMDYNSYYQDFKNNDGHGSLLSSDRQYVELTQRRIRLAMGLVVQKYG